MLPLNQLEELSNAHADIISKKKALSEKMAEIEYEEEVAKRIKNALADAEKRIMKSVKEGLKTAYISAYEIDQHRKEYEKFYNLLQNAPKEKNYAVTIGVAKELEKQGFHIKKPIKVSGYPWGSKYGSFDISWENFKPNPKYEAPNFEKQLETLHTKIEKMNKLVRDAERILAE